MPTQNTSHIRSWPRYPLHLLSRGGSPQSAAPARCVQFDTAALEACPAGHTLFGQTPPPSSKAALPRPMVRSTSWQRLQHCLQRAQSGLRAAPKPQQVGTRSPTPAEQHLIDKIHSEATGVAAAADNGPSLLQAAATFHTYIKSQQVTHRLEDDKLTQLLQRDSMAVFLQRLSRLHGRCDEANLRAWQALCRQWCGAPPPPALLALIWLQTMLVHQPDTGAVAISHLDVLDAALEAPSARKDPFDAQWMQHKDAANVPLRLGQAFMNWQDAIESRLPDTNFTHHRKALCKRISQTRSHIETLVTGPRPEGLTQTTEV